VALIYSRLSLGDLPNHRDSGQNTDALWVRRTHCWTVCGYFHFNQTNGLVLSLNVVQVLNEINTTCSLLHRRCHFIFEIVARSIVTRRLRRLNWAPPDKGHRVTM
jgi:nicotinamide riboside transporter PnuC